MSCRPSGPFEEDGSGPPIFSNKHYFYFSNGNLKVSSEWLCFSPNLLCLPLCQSPLPARSAPSQYKRHTKLAYLFRLYSWYFFLKYLYELTLTFLIKLIAAAG